MRNLILSLLLIPGLVSGLTELDRQEIPERSHVVNSGFEAALQNISTYSDAETATMTIASPAVVTVADTSTMWVGFPFQFTTTGALPTGVSASTTYYISTIVSSTTFQFSATLGGSAVNSSGSQSGTHTFRPIYPVNGTGGTVCTSYTATKVTGSAVDQTSSLSISKPASNCLGTGTAYTVTLPGAQYVTVDWDYFISSGTYSPGSSTTDSDQEFWVYDVTNGKVIQPNVYKVDGTVQTTNRLHFQAGFQTSSGSASYRLLWHTATNSASAYTLKPDNFTARIKVGNKGTVTTSPQSWAAAGSFTGFGTPTSITSSWVRRGSRLAAAITFTTGTCTATEARLALPTGLTTSSAYPTLALVGKGNGGTASAAHFGGKTVLAEASKTYVTFGAELSTRNGYEKLNGNTIFSDATAYSFFFEVEIEGWGATGNVSNDDGRVVIAKLTGNAASASSGNPIIFPTVTSDTHAAYSVSTGKYTAPVQGCYKIFGFMIGTNSPKIYIYKNGVQGDLIGELNADSKATISGSVCANANDLIDIRPDATYDGIASANITIEKMGGGSYVSPNESVAMFYSGQPTGSLGTSFNLATLPTKQTDTHGIYASGIATVPVSGTYAAGCQLGMNTSSKSADDESAASLFLNGSEKYTGYEINGASTTQSYPQVHISGWKLVAGDQVKCMSEVRGGSPAFNSSATRSFFYLNRTGP